jgi:hypothetical protein
VVALAQPELAHLLYRDVDVVPAGEVPLRSQEAVTLLPQVEQARAGHWLAGPGVIGSLVALALVRPLVALALVGPLVALALVTLAPVPPPAPTPTVPVAELVAVAPVLGTGIRSAAPGPVVALGLGNTLVTISPTGHRVVTGSAVHGLAAGLRRPFAAVARGAWPSRSYLLADR